MELSTGGEGEGGGFTYLQGAREVTVDRTRSLGRGEFPKGGFFGSRKVKLSIVAWQQPHGMGMSAERLGEHWQSLSESVKVASSRRASQIHAPRTRFKLAMGCMMTMTMTMHDDDA